MLRHKQLRAFRYHRLKSLYSIREVVHLSGLAVTTIWRLENQNNQYIPDRLTLVKWGQAFGFSPDIMRAMAMGQCEPTTEEWEEVLSYRTRIDTSFFEEK